MTDQRRGWLWKMLLEVLLIGVAVFLGMAADQWRTDRQHREQARAALLRFKAEIETNRKAVASVSDYHAQLRTQINAYLDPKLRPTVKLRMEGLKPVNFERTAWDLALATQSLADIDSSLAFEIARVYGMQDMYTSLTNSLIQAMYLRPPSENLEGFFHSLKIYLDDIVSFDPGVINAYDRVLPLIDSALRD